MSKSNTPTSVANFFRTMARMEPQIGEFSSKIIRKFAKAFRLIAEYGFTMDHLQVIIYDPDTRKKIVEILELHLSNPYLEWYRCLNVEGLFTSSPHALTLLDVAALSNFMLEGNTSRSALVGKILSFCDDDFFDIDGLCCAQIQKIKPKLSLLRF